ncbi:hypothetical protein [Solibacillus sp. FSL H8-0538]|uniref:hypothetical protein n=1 Tax=Solibacillus sp. FSL H8-0538 TaxID=2921400 RepID=UPI0030F6A8A8
MIVLVKLFNKGSYREGNEYGAAKPFAIYEEGNFTILKSEEDYVEYFPNTGKIFVPYKHNVEQIFALYQLSESNTFESDRITSNKYILSKEEFSHSFYELIDLFYSVENDYETIIRLLRKGIRLDYLPKNDVVFRTKDGYLIGPVKLIENEFGYGLKNIGFVPYYKVQINAVTIFDDFIRKNRSFFVYEFNTEIAIGNFDLADDKTILSFVLQHLKANTELGEISRKLKQNLSAWLTTQVIEEKYIVDRFNRIITLIDNKTLDDGFQKHYTTQLLSLELTQTIIEHNTSQKFKDEYNKFAKENKLLLDEIKSNHSLLSQKARELNETEEKLSNTQKLLSTIEQTFHQKIERLQNDYTTVYANELLKSSIEFQPRIQNSRQQSEYAMYFDFSSEKGFQHNSLEDVIDILKLNLKIFNARDSKKALSSTIISAIMRELPLIITGKYSLELANCLSKTISSEEVLTVIPELESFGVKALESLFYQYTDEENVKSLIFHNIHLTTAQYSLPMYFKQLKWSKNNLTPNLWMLTLDKEDDANELLSTLGEVPVINSEQFIQSSIRKKQVQELTMGQLNLKNLDLFIKFEDIRGLEKDFIEWYLANNEKIEDLELTTDLVEWLYYYTNIIGVDDGYMAFSKLFNKYLPSEGL